MEFFDIIKNISYKKNIQVDIDMSLCFGLCTVFKQNTENLLFLKKILPFLFWIEPKHFYYLLFFHLPMGQKRGVRNPTQKGGIDPTIKKERPPLPIFEKIRYILGWSKKEFLYNMPLLEVHRSKYQKQWEEELGVRNENI